MTLYPFVSYFISFINFNSLGFSIDQLMELAGFSVASAAHAFLSPEHTDQLKKTADILILCGPGNNGGDGLVAARHLKHFGYSPAVVYPKKSKGQLFDNLVKQCLDLDIPVYADIADILKIQSESSISFSLILDALFGFSFAGPARPPFTELIAFMTDSSIPVLSVDIPSGWHVEDGDIYSTGFLPDAVISLTVPKYCMSGYKGVHYVGGRYTRLSLYINVKDVIHGFNMSPYFFATSMTFRCFYLP